MRCWPEVARRSASGARAASFSVAGRVRHGLEALGFAVERRPGFGAKRQRLEARLPEPTPAAPSGPDPRIAIVGAGVAGAALARAFRALGADPLVIEAAAPGDGASGNPAALVMPRLDAGGGPVAQLFAQAFARAADLYAALPDATIATGAVQRQTGPKDPSRFDRIAASDLFASGMVERLPDGLRFHEALVVDPAVVLAAWLAGGEMRLGCVRRIERHDHGWRLADDHDALIAEVDIVCLANGVDAAVLAPGLPLSPVRGQVSFCPADQRLDAAIGGGYVVATREGFLFGATHDRGSNSREVSAADHLRNLELLRPVNPALAAQIDPTSLSGRAGVRAVTADFLPLAGAVGAGPGLFVLSGLGSRGFCAAPLLAEHVAALALGTPSPLPQALSALVDPGRFAVRQARRRSGMQRTRD